MNYQVWGESWQAPAQWMETVERLVRVAGATVLRGGDFDRWDLELRGGLLGSCRVRMMVEEHGAGRQLVRFRFWPRPALLILVVMALLVGGLADAALSHALTAFAFLAGLEIFVGFHIVLQGGAAMATVGCAVQRIQADQSYEPAGRTHLTPIPAQGERCNEYS